MLNFESQGIIDFPLLQFDKFENTFLVIGRITSLFFDEIVLADDGFLDLEKADSVCSVGLDGYYKAQKINRFPYAKP